MAHLRKMFTPACSGCDIPFKPELLIEKPDVRPYLRERKENAARKISAIHFIRRQAFRAALAEAIMTRGGEEAITAADLPFDHERTVSRYHFYVTRGLDVGLAPPMDAARLAGVLRRVPARLRRLRGTERALAKEAREEYARAMRKATVDFALGGDPGEHDEAAAARLFDSAERRELKMMSRTWRTGYEAARLKIQRNLHPLNPCLIEITQLWNSDKYQNLRLVNIRKMPEALELAEFRSIVLEHIEKTRSFLKNEWLSTIQDIFVKYGAKKLVPGPRERRRQRSFYSSVAVAMSHQLQSLCVRSVQDYTRLVCDPQLNPGFVTRVSYEPADGFLFAPTFGNFEDVILDLYDSIAGACDNIPRVESLIYLDDHSHGVLKPVIPVDVVSDAKRKVLVELYAQWDGPLRQLREFDPFLYLVDGTARAEAARLEDVGEQFEDIADLVARLDAAVLQVPCEVLPEARLGMFVVDRQPTIAKMTRGARRLQNQLLDRVQDTYRKMRDSLLEDCRAMEARASGEPDSVEELLQLIEYVRGLEVSRLQETAERAADYLRLFLLLAEQRRGLSDQDLLLNRQLLQWPRRMDAVLDAHREMVERKTQQLAADFFA